MYNIFLSPLPRNVKKIIEVERLKRFFCLNEASLKSFSKTEIIFSGVATTTSSFLLLFYLATLNHLRVLRKEKSKRIVNGACFN